MALTHEQIDAAYRVVWTTVPHRNRLSAFAHHIEAEVRKDDEALIRQMLEALEIEVVEWAPGFLAGLYDSDEPTENAARTKILAALKSARSRLEKAP